MVNKTIEPGLFSVFRLFTGLRLIFAIIFALGEWANPEQDVRILGLLEPMVLMLVLSLPISQAKHGHLLLPAALVVAGVGPLLVQVEGLSIYHHRNTPIETLLALLTWSSMIVLLLPVVIIGWQYSFRHVVVFAVGVTTLNVLIVGLDIGFQALNSPMVLGALLTRMVVFLVIGWLIVRLMTAQREHRRALTEANLNLSHHAATREQLALTRERNRLARELHDTLAHTLSAVAVQLEAVDALWTSRPEQARERLRKTIEVTRSGLTETRRVLQDLRATPLEDLGLALAIRGLAQSTALRCGAELDLSIDDHLGSVSPDVEQSIYRIAQETLANVANHADARHLTIKLDRVDSRVILIISDDGKGFNFNDSISARHLGIRGMRERAELIGGTLELKSQPGQGTTVTLSVEAGS